MRLTRLTAPATLALAVLAAPLAGAQQSPKMVRLGWLGTSLPTTGLTETLQRALRRDSESSGTWKAKTWPSNADIARATMNNSLTSQPSWPV
jgi:hypothetical protein